jgi:hypothetical protein
MGLNLGNLLNKGVQGYTNLVDKVINMPGATQAIAVASGVPGMDKILTGIEKLIPDGGIKLGGNNPKATTKNQLGDNVNQKSTKVVSVDSTTTVEPFDYKKWSTYPKWAQYTIIGAVPGALILWALMQGMGKGKGSRRY